MLFEWGLIPQIIESVGGIGVLAQIIGGIGAFISAIAMILYYRKISKSVKEQVRARETDKFKLIAEKVLSHFITILEEITPSPSHQ